MDASHVDFNGPGASESGIPTASIMPREHKRNPTGDVHYVRVCVRVLCFKTDEKVKDGFRDTGGRGGSVREGGGCVKSETERSLYAAEILDNRHQVCAAKQVDGNKERE